MLVANELRVGNWVEYMEDGTLFRVTEINLTGVSVTNSEESTWIELDRFSGVRLTQDILKNAGFKNGRLGNFWFLRGFDLAIDGTEYDYNGIYIGKVPYLHQLQNIYFALNNEELNVEI